MRRLCSRCRSFFSPCRCSSPRSCTVLMLVSITQILDVWRSSPQRLEPLTTFRRNQLFVSPLALGMTAFSVEDRQLGLIQTRLPSFLGLSAFFLFLAGALHVASYYQSQFWDILMAAMGLKRWQKKWRTLRLPWPNIERQPVPSPAEPRDTESLAELGSPG